MQTIRSVYVSFQNVHFLKKYVSSTYNSSILVYWSILERSNYGTNGYSFTFPTEFLISLSGATFITNLADYYINPAFWIDLSSDLFKVDSFEKIAIFMTAITTERDFKSE